MIRGHLRSNVIGYVALFVALSGTAIADHPGGADTISSQDIINGEVKAIDISNTNGVGSPDVRDDTEPDGGLAAVDLAAESVGHSEIAADAVASLEIQENGVGSPELTTNAVGWDEIQTDAVRSSEILTGAVGDSEIETDAVGSAELAENAVNSSHLPIGAVGAEEIRGNAVSSGHIANGEVGASELAGVHEHRSSLVTVYDDTNEHDGAYGQNSGTVSCEAGEQLLGASIDWIDTVGHNEATVKDINLHRSGDDWARVVGIHDGGNVYATFKAVATCIGD